MVATSKKLILTLAFLIAMPVFASDIVLLQPQPTIWQQFKGLFTHKFGSTITTLLGSDTLTASRAVINTNFSNLNTDKIESSVTSLLSLTTATALASIGTITTGIWHGTPITVTYGGTSSTTLASNYLLVGNGTGIIKTVDGQGTSGQILTSAGAGLAPVWGSGTIDLTQNYTWTGLHIFSAGLISSASSTINSNLNITGNSTTTSATTTNFYSTTASTTNLFIGGTQTGGATTYTASSTIVSGLNPGGGGGSTTYTGSIPTTANIIAISLVVTDSTIPYTYAGDLIIFRTGKTSGSFKSQISVLGSNSDYDYTFSFSGNDLVVTENSDEGTDSTISFNAYYYK